MIAKALVHQPLILFLDEPTAGVDVGLRRDMWELVRELRRNGVTIILTTHYIEEAEEMADRIGIIHHGKIIMIEEKTELMSKMGKKCLTLTLANPLKSIPPALEMDHLALSDDGTELVYAYNIRSNELGLDRLLRKVLENGIQFKDLKTTESSLEEIFVSLVGDAK